MHTGINTGLIQKKKKIVTATSNQNLEDYKYNS